MKILVTGFAGVLTGVLSGMFGVGGAVVSTPAIRALGAGPLAAVGSTLPSILPSALSGTYRYRRQGLIHTRLVLWVALPGVLAAVGGSLATDVVPGDGHPLMILTAGLVAYSAYRLSRTPAGVRDTIPLAASTGILELGDETAAAVEPVSMWTGTGAAPVLPRHDDWWRLALIGIGAGGLSGLLGIGGGVLMVPAFVSWLKVPLKEALGTSLACVGVLAIPGTITHAILGHIDWLFALPLCVGVVPGASLGAHLTIRSSEHLLRILVGFTLGIVAVVYATGEIVALF